MEMTAAKNIVRGSNFRVLDRRSKTRSPTDTPECKETPEEATSIRANTIKVAINSRTKPIR